MLSHRLPAVLFRSPTPVEGVSCPLINDGHRLFVLWPATVSEISQHSWRMPANSLSRIQCGTGIFGKSNFISTNMRKMKTNTTQTANYHPLGPLSLIFLWETQNGRQQCAPPGKKKKKVGSWSCSLCPRDSPPRLDNTGWHTGTPRDFSNLLFHAQSYKLRDRHQSGIFCAMWRESSPNPVPLILLIAWAWPTLFIGVEPTVSQKANER